MKNKSKMPIPATPKFKPRDFSNTMPGYKINEYLLVLNPNEALREKIMQVKQQFYEEYENEAAVYARPNITLVNFVQYQMLEERLVNKLETVAMGFPPVKIE